MTAVIAAILVLPLPLGIDQIYLGTENRLRMQNFENPSYLLFGLKSPITSRM